MGNMNYRSRCEKNHNFFDSKGTTCIKDHIFPMKNRRFARHGLVLLPLGLMIGGCGLLLGLDEFVDQPPGTGGAGGEGKVCEPGETRPCYDGPAGTEGQGICAEGVQACDAAGAGWGVCEGAVLPGVEDCNVRGDEDCDGNPCSDALWSRIYGGVGTQRVTDLAVDHQGNVVIVGYFDGTVALGGTTLVTSGGKDYFLAKLDPDGDLLWAKQFGSAGDNGSLVRVAVGVLGDIVIAGELQGNVDFGDGALSAAGTDAFVVAFGPAGDHRWGKRFGDASNQLARGVAISPQGRVVVAGNFAGTVNFGGAGLTASGTFTDAFLVSFSLLDGGHEWSKQLGDAAGQTASAQQSRSVSVDAAGNISMVGTFEASIDFGGESVNNAGFGNDFVARFDAAGTYVWSRSYKTCSMTNAADDSQGNLFLAGALVSTTNFGGDDLIPAGQYDIFLASFDVAGNHRWSRRFGGPNQDFGGDISLDSQGNIVIAGVSDGGLDFGGGLLQGHYYDIYVVKLDPAGGHLWSKLLGDEGEQSAAGLAIDPTSQAILFAGTNGGVIDFGTGPLTSTGVLNTVVAKFAP